VSGAVCIGVGVGIGIGIGIGMRAEVWHERRRCTC
jgi:hypothetical protein